MSDAIGKALRQLEDSAIWRALLLNIALSVGCLVVLWGGASFLLIDLIFTSFPLSTIGGLETAITILGGFATLILPWMMFPAAASGLIGLFLDGVADAVEARHYPDLAPGRGQSTIKVLIAGGRFIGILIVLNLFLLLFLFFPPLFPFVFYAVNGYLLGREYFEIVALRRVSRAAAARLRRKNRGALFIMGILIASLLTVPVVNLLVPIVATMAMVHLFHRWSRDGGQTVPDQAGEGLLPKPSS